MYPARLSTGRKVSMAKRASKSEIKKSYREQASEDLSEREDDGKAKKDLSGGTDRTGKIVAQQNDHSLVAAMFQASKTREGHEKDVFVMHTVTGEVSSRTAR